ncbi:MAG: hypothetical protein ABL921_21425, partial [Pirellula sp.]
ASVGNELQQHNKQDFHYTLDLIRHRHCHASHRTCVSLIIVADKLEDLIAFGRYEGMALSRDLLIPNRNVLMPVL